jgi:DNA-binding XRE family transcriptional regulator
MTSTETRNNLPKDVSPQAVQEYAESRPVRRTFAKNMKDTRQAKGLTLSKLAKRMGCSPQHLHQYESGKRSPSIDAALAIARAMRTGITRLTKGM